MGPGSSSPSSPGGPTGRRSRTCSTTTSRRSGPCRTGTSSGSPAASPTEPSLRRNWPAGRPENERKHKMNVVHGPVRPQHGRGTHSRTGIAAEKETNAPERRRSRRHRGAERIQPSAASRVRSESKRNDAVLSELNETSVQCDESPVQCVHTGILDSLVHAAGARTLLEDRGLRSGVRRWRRDCASNAATEAPSCWRPRI